jgi:hypothetical protein
MRIYNSITSKEFEKEQGENLHTAVNRLSILIVLNKIMIIQGLLKPNNELLNLFQSTVKCSSLPTASIRDIKQSADIKSHKK